MGCLMKVVRRNLVAAGFVAVITSAAPGLAWAESGAVRPAADVAATAAEPESPRDLVAAQLVALGLTKEEAALRVAALTDEDLGELAQHPEQLGMGGVKDKTLIIVAAILVLPTILLLVLL